MVGRTGKSETRNGVHVFLQQCEDSLRVRFWDISRTVRSLGILIDLRGKRRFARDFGVANIRFGSLDEVDHYFDEHPELTLVLD